MSPEPGSLSSRPLARQAAGLFLLAFMAGCATRPGAPVPQSTRTVPPDAIPRQEPLSKYGNGPFYVVNGRRYEVLGSSNGYSERGVASWYGPKFHGRPTSSHEPYDMNAMTAAHKTLPLPTYVRVRNLANGKSVVVRVNDRGPFVDNRLIDLSYAAAQRLDMIRDGTTLVEVTAIGFGEPEPNTLVASRGPEPAAESGAGTARVFLQVGAFGNFENAQRRYAQLQDGGFDRAFVQETSAPPSTLYRVRIGPIADVAEYDSMVARLHGLGITDTQLVTE